jgi:hypothetical protein
MQMRVSARCMRAFMAYVVGWVRGYAGLVELFPQPGRVHVESWLAALRFA